MMGELWSSGEPGAPTAHAQPESTGLPSWGSGPREGVWLVLTCLPSSAPCLRCWCRVPCLCHLPWITGCWVSPSILSLSFPCCELKILTTQRLFMGSADLREQVSSGKPTLPRIWGQSGTRALSSGKERETLREQSKAQRDH